MADKKSKIIGFRPTARQQFELENICSELKIRKSALIRFLIEDFIDKYERAEKDEQLEQVQKDVE